MSLTYIRPARLGAPPPNQQVSTLTGLAALVGKQKRRSGLAKHPVVNGRCQKLAGPNRSDLVY